MPTERRSNRMLNNPQTAASLSHNILNTPASNYLWREMANNSLWKFPIACYFSRFSIGPSSWSVSAGSVQNPNFDSPFTTATLVVTSNRHVSPPIRLDDMTSQHNFALSADLKRLRFSLDIFIRKLAQTLWRYTRIVRTACVINQPKLRRRMSYYLGTTCCARY